MVAILLALSAALTWGCADYLGGLQARRLAVLSVVALSQLAGFVVVAIVVAIRWESPPGSTQIGAALLAGLFVGGATAALYKALAIGPMSMVAPVVSTGAIVPVVVGIARGERPSTAQLAGMAAAVFGVALVSWERERPGAPRTARRLSILLGLAAAVQLGLTLVALDVGAEGDPYWTVMLARSVTVAGGFGLLVALRRRLAVPRSSAPALGTLGALEMLGNLLFALALTRGFLSVVAVLGSLYTVVTVALAHVHLKERLALAQALGAIVTLTGVGLVVAG